MIAKPLLVHMRSQHLNTHGLVMERISCHFLIVKKNHLLQSSTIENVQRTIREKERKLSCTHVLSILSHRLQHMCIYRRLYPQEHRTSVLSTTLQRLGRALDDLSKMSMGRQRSASTQPGSRNTAC